MAPPTIDMRTIKDVLPLKLHGGLSHEATARGLSVRERMVAKHAALASAAGLESPPAVEPPGLAALKRRLFGASAEQRHVLRPRKGSAYRACRRVTLQSAEGDRPMSIVWKLETPLPVRLFREFSVLRGV